MPWRSARDRSSGREGRQATLELVGGYYDPHSVGPLGFLELSISCYSSESNTIPKRAGDSNP